jgi:hypothetical protein
MWEADEYRDISMAIGGSRYTITRDSDTQITVGGVDLSTANGILFAGQTIKIINSVSAEKHGRVVTATFSSPDTVIVVDWTEGEVADGTSRDLSPHDRHSRLHGRQPRQRDAHDRLVVH